MQMAISAEALAKRWDCSPGSIRNMEHDGRLHRLPDLPGARYSIVEVTQLETLGKEAQGLTAWERRQMKERINELEELVAELQGRLAKVMLVAQGGGAT